jgi:hypothetical protein
MDLTLRTEVVETMPVVAVHGEVDLATVPRLRDGLHRELGNHPGRTLIVDLDGVTVFEWRAPAAPISWWWPVPRGCGRCSARPASTPCYHRRRRSATP